jgi:archaellum component FlaG (FlaF/FlaG flagellin family)
VGYIATIIITTPIGAVLSKEVSPIARSMANISRIVIIWVFNIAITFSFPNDPQYQLESRNIYVNISKLIGFLLLALGMFVYLFKKSGSEKK